MKFVICLIGAVTAGMASAQPLVINGQNTGTVVESMTIRGNIIDILTVGREAFTVGGQPTIPPPISPPVSPPVSSGCISSPTLVCAYNIDWTAPNQGMVRLQVTAGKTLASRFITSTSPTTQYTLSLQPPAGFPFSVISFWVSADPNGQPLPRCSGQISIEGSLRMFLQPRSGCVLSTNTTYYLVMQHAVQGAPTSTIDRKQSVFGTP